MKTILKLNLTAMLCAGLCVFASTSAAQDAGTQTLDRPQDANRAADLDDQASGTNVRASQLIGMNIENSAEENVGEIKDLVIDAQQREIRYVAVTYGGFLGIGNAMHAVPFEAFKFKADPDDPADTVLVLNVTQEQMEGAEGFDEDHWPNFADDAFTRSTNRRYGINRTHRSARNAASSESRDAASERSTVTRRNQNDVAVRTGELDDKTRGTNIRASQLIGLDIENSAKEKVGTINDIVVNARDGQVRYSVVSYGGFLGIGDELHAVPFESFQCKTDPDDASETVLVLNVTQQQMKGAKGFDENNWPDFADEDFTRQIDRRYGLDRKYDGTRQAANPTNTGVNVRDRDDSAKTPFDQNENQKDIDITANIRKRVVDTEMSVNAQNVKIITQNGRVTLRGPVKSADEKRQIEKLAQQVAGATNVDNQLEIQR